MPMPWSRDPLATEATSRSSSKINSSASKRDVAPSAVAGAVQHTSHQDMSSTNGKTSVAATGSSSRLHAATLLLSCAEPGSVIAELSTLLYGLGCRILESDQFTDTGSGYFFQRIHFDYSSIITGVTNTPVLEQSIADLASRFELDWNIQYSNRIKRVAVLVSKIDHCLFDLLIRRKSEELKCEIPVVVSNHPDLKHIADMFGVPFVHLPLDKDLPDGKAQQEAEIERVLQEYKIDVLVLARYMQIFTPEFCSRHAQHTINIHHSFLPAFEGARPYHRAHERGVKLIGATAHYATGDLDAGPIIEQNIARITHRDSVADMIRKGRDLERLVLARAVRWHLDDRILVHGNKTVVFED
ncbi:MAG: hypothetical protein WDW38_001398 [Sanguina aurantia]